MILKFSDSHLTVCPECGKPVQKLLSAPAIQFKGTGWYITDYARKSASGDGAGKDAEAGSGKTADGGAAKDASSSTSTGAPTSKESGAAKDGSSSVSTETTPSRDTSSTRTSK